MATVRTTRLHPELFGPKNRHLIISSSPIWAAEIPDKAKRVTKHLRPSTKQRSISQRSATTSRGSSPVHATLLLRGWCEVTSHRGLLERNGDVQHLAPNLVPIRIVVKSPIFEQSIHRELAALLFLRQASLGDSVRDRVRQTTAARRDLRTRPAYPFRKSLKASLPSALDFGVHHLEARFLCDF